MSPRPSPPSPPSPPPSFAIGSAAAAPSPSAPSPSRRRARASPPAHPHRTPHQPEHGYPPAAFVHGPTLGYPPAPSDQHHLPAQTRPDAPQYPYSLKYPAALSSSPAQPTASSSSQPYPYPYPPPPYAYPPYIPRLPASSSPPMAITLPYAPLPSPHLVTLSRPDERDNSDGEGDNNDDPEGKHTEVVPLKRHACIMCHKSFDRPCTLRKHMKVHTGEREFECQFCSRRFGVSSNKKRHERKCPQRPSTSDTDAPPPASPDQPSSSQPTASSSSLPASTSTAGTTATTSTTSISPTPTPTPIPSTSNPRKRRASPPSASPNPTTSSLSLSSPPKPKRRRRAPSPSKWVPESLRWLDLTPHGKATPVPLPPVQPQLSRGEERDSFDASVGADAQPYHPREWRGRLPGPALMQPECFAGSAGGMGGQVLVL